jgi:hypothetical protein
VTFIAPPGIVLLAFGMAQSCLRRAGFASDVGNGRKEACRGQRPVALRRWDFGGALAA